MTRCGSRLFIGFAVSALLGGTLPAIAAAAPTLQWGGDVDLEAFATSDLFPGGPTRESDRGLKLELRPEITARLAHGMRVRPWARWVGERYEDWTPRNLDRWDFGVDLRKGPFRLRGSAGFTRDELYFPTTSGGAFLDRDHWTVEGRYEPSPGWMGEAAFTREQQDFIPIYNERDNRRLTFEALAERRLSKAARVSLAYLLRRSDSMTDLYTYAQNALRAEGSIDQAAGFSAHALGEFALRSYRTGQPFALNFGRQDDRWRAELGIGHALAGPLRIEVRGRVRRVASTRDSKDYVAQAAGLALTATR